MTPKLRIWLLFVQIFVFQAGFGIVVPLIPLYTQKFAIGTVGVGFVVAVYGLARVLTDLPAARLIGAVGHSRAMAIGALTLTIGSVLTAFSGSFAELLAYRFLSGVGAAITLVAGQTMAATNPGPYSRAKAIGYYQAWFLAGVGIGPMFSGPIVEVWGDRAPFLVYAGLAAAVGLLGFMARTPEVIEDHEQEHPSVLGSLTLLRDVPFLLVSTIALMMFFTRTGGLHSLVPLLGEQNYALPTTLIGVAIGLNGIVNLVVTFLTGAFMERFDRRTLLLPGSGMLVAGMVVFAVSSSPVSFFAAACLIGAGAGLAGPVSALYVADRAPRNVTGAMALYRMISDIGYLLGPILMGLSAAGWGIPVTFLWCAAALATVVLIFVAHQALTSKRTASVARTSEFTSETASNPSGVAVNVQESHISGRLSHVALGPISAPRMIFVHPNPMDSSTWMYQMTHFSTWYRCIAVDIPGYGTSAKALPGVTMAEVAEAVWSASDTAGGDASLPAVLVGCSVGSHIVEFMYYARPEETAAVVLSGTGWGGGGKREFAIKRAQQYREEGLRFRWTHAFEDFSPEFRKTDLAMWYADLIAERAHTADADSIAEMFVSRIAPDPEEFYTGLTVPVLILSGSLDNSHQGAIVLDKKLPDSTLITLNGAGHACYFERPREFDAHMISFLRDRLPSELRPTPDLARRFAAEPAARAGEAMP